MKRTTFMTIMGASALAATTAFAQTSMTMTPDNLVGVDQIDDATIYRMELTDGDMWSDMTGFDGVEAEWVAIGEIEEVLLDRQGQMVAVLASIGGFLDIGDRDVILPLENVRFSASETNEYAFVTNLTEDELATLPEVDEDIWD
jgi:hypothetical protein